MLNGPVTVAVTYTVVISQLLNFTVLYRLFGILAGPAPHVLLGQRRGKLQLGCTSYECLARGLRGQPQPVNTCVSCYEL